MIEIIKNILSKNADQIDKRNKSITFTEDFEGKGLLNKEISKLYDKKTILSEQQFTDVVINSNVIIGKMAKLKKSDWDISDLKNQLVSGVANYHKQNGNEFKYPASKFINATSISKHFNVSSQRINLILSELGLIEKDIAGWRITKLGKRIGGRQLEHESSGNSYVAWTESILLNKRILEFFKEAHPEQPIEEKPTSVSIPTTTSPPNPTIYHDTFREKFPATHRTLDGHYVRSKSEILIDNFLYINGIVHAYERKLPIEEDVYCDFYIPSGNNSPQVYIEFWGLVHDQKYLNRKKKKIEIYKKYEFPLIELTEQEINNLEEVLTRKLIQHKINVR